MSKQDNHDQAYWDPVDFVRRDAYTDWEGFTSPDDMAEQIHALRDINAMTVDLAPNAMREFLCDITLHWVHEQIDQADLYPSGDEVATIYFAFLSLFQGGIQSRSNLDWSGGEGGWFPQEQPPLDPQD